MQQLARTAVFTAVFSVSDLSSDVRGADHFENPQSAQEMSTPIDSVAYILVIWLALNAQITFAYWTDLLLFMYPTGLIGSVFVPSCRSPILSAKERFLMLKENRWAVLVTVALQTQVYVNQPPTIKITKATQWHQQ